MRGNYSCRFPISSALPAAIACSDTTHKKKTSRVRDVLESSKVGGRREFFGEKTAFWGLPPPPCRQGCSLALQCKSNRNRPQNSGIVRRFWDCYGVQPITACAVGILTRFEVQITHCQRLAVFGCRGNRQPTFGVFLIGKEYSVVFEVGNVQIIARFGGRAHPLKEERGGVVKHYVDGIVVAAEVELVELVRGVEDYLVPLDIISRFTEVSLPSKPTRVRAFSLFSVSSAVSKSITLPLNTLLKSCSFT